MCGKTRRLAAAAADVRVASKGGREGPQFDGRRQAPDAKSIRKYESFGEKVNREPRGARAAIARTQALDHGDSDGVRWTLAQTGR